MRKIMSSLKYISTTLMTVLVLINYISVVFSACNFTSQRHSQKMTEFSDCTLSPHEPNHKKSQEAGLQPDNQPKYELFIRPKGNEQNLKDTPTFKVLVEADYENLKLLSQNSSQQEVIRKLYQVLPLTIETINLNMGTVQKEKIYLNAYSKSNQGSNEATSKRYPVKSQTNITGDFQSNKTRNDEQSYETGKKLMNIYASEKVNVYRDTRLSDQISDFRIKPNTNASIADLKIPLNVGYEEKFLRSGSYQKNNGNLRTEKVGTFEHTIPYSDNISYSNPVSSERMKSYTGAEISQSNTFQESGRSLGISHSVYPSDSVFSDRSTINEERIKSDRSYNVERNPTETRSVRNLIRAEEFVVRPTYVESSSTLSSERRTTTIDFRNLRSHSTANTPNDQKRISQINASDRNEFRQTSQERYMVDKDEIDVNPASSTGLPYETIFDIKQQAENDHLGSRPTRDNSYSGFPESFNANSYTSSKPTPYDGPATLPISPCPNIFKYTRRDEDRWFGNIFISTNEVLVGMRLDITLDRVADLFVTWSAEVQSRDNVHFTILSLKKKLVPNYPEIVQIMVKFNEKNQAPYLQMINLNGRNICNGKKSGSTQKTSTKRPTYVFPGDLQGSKRTTERYSEVSLEAAIISEYSSTTKKPIRKPGNASNWPTSRPEPIPDSNPDFYEGLEYSMQHRPIVNNAKRPSSNSKPLPIGSNNFEVQSTTYRTTGSGNVQKKQNVPCGQPAVQPRPLITNGQMTTRGQWPWHAALYKNVGPNLSYSCGGSLITNLHVITAAHCVTLEYSSRPYDAKIFLVYFGKYHLHVWTENGLINREVSRITVHPNYNATNFRSDLAVLTLSNKIDFTDYVRPVCLWDRRNIHIEDIVGLQGTVVGWGFDETKHLTEELRQASMPIVEHNQCLWSYPEFYPRFTSNTTYCAGFKNGTSVCNGDSGGGMVFPFKINGEERWYLRGLVSLSPGVKDTRVCDTKHYVVFTDVAKYLVWLEDVISSG